MNKNINSAEKISSRCRHIQSQIPDYLTGDLDAETVASVKNHASACETCGKELEELTVTWTQLGILPEEQPGPNLRRNFYTMLESYKEGLASKPARKFFETFKINNIWEKLWPRRPVYQFALAAVFLLSGIAAGYFMQSPAKVNRQIMLLRRENREVRQQLAISLLNQSSPSQRLKGLNFSSHLEEPGSEILETLLHTLDNDPNVNVRLSAVDALYLFAGHPRVKEGLVQSLQKQTSPLVQMALIDLMVQMREKQAIKSLRQLLKNNKLNPDVKQRARVSIEQLL